MRISSHVFIFILLLSLFTITGSFQNVFALTPVADLTGQWSGFAQVSFTDTPCATSGNVNGYFTQNENSLSGSFSFVPTNAGSDDGVCSYEPWDLFVEGTLDGSRITLSSEGITFSGWYASSGIKLDFAADWLTGTTQLSPTGFTPPAFESEPPPPPPEDEPTQPCPPGQYDGGDGYCYYEDESTCPPGQYDGGDGYCYYEDESTCPPGQYDGGDGYCYYEDESTCPPGQYDGGDGYCYYDEEQPEEWAEESPEEWAEESPEEWNTQPEEWVEEPPEKWAEDLPIAGDAPNIVFPTRIPDNFFRVNGCGSQGEGGVDVPDFDFAESCNQHDICYARGGDAEDRKICDEEMYESVKSNSVLGKFGATIYYWGVRLGGASSFNCASDSC